MKMVLFQTMRQESTFPQKDKCFIVKIHSTIILIQAVKTLKQKVEETQCSQIEESFYRGLIKISFTIYTNGINKTCSLNYICYYWDAAAQKNKLTPQALIITFLQLSAMSKINKIDIKDASKHNKYKIQNIFVYTPHEIYEAQQTFITYVIKCLQKKQNALIQSPTGTGKTMSLLCSTLSWAMQQQQTKKQPPPQIIYASRTHAQLKQVVKQIEKLCYQVKIAILSSREFSCANEQLKLLRAQDKQLECRIRIAQKKGLSCKFYKNQSYLQKHVEVKKPMDVEQIVLKGKAEQFCPFYYEKLAKTTANIVLIPYNYLFDKKVWTSEEGVRLQGSILILDQAHNIQSVCEQYREYSLTLGTLTRSTHQLEEIRLEKISENKNKLDPGHLDKIKMLKVSLQDIEINASYMQLIYENIQTLDIPTDSTGVLYTSKQFAQLLDKFTSPSQFGTISRNIKQLVNCFQNFRTDMLFSPYWALESWMKFIEKLMEIINPSGQRAGVSQFKIQVAHEGADIRITIHCLDPSSGFKEVIQEHKPHSVILTSGTLSPLKVWPLELGVQFAQPMSCPHVLSSQQVNTVILGVGASGKSIETKFENRKSTILYQDIGNALLQIVKNTPNGVVALFPSYKFLEETRNHLSTQNLFTKLYQYKNVYFQRKDSTDFAPTLQRYMKQAETDKGALLCALIRGRVSEGLDFSQKKCRAVVVVGVPYPCSKDVKVVAKMNYLDALNLKGQKTITGSQWYLAETIRAINQGIGRLIRTPDDFGTVYLIDSRFAKPDIEGQLASWARISMFKPSKYEQFVRKVKEINNIKDIKELINIQEDLGFISNRGTVITSQNISIAPPKTIRASISRQLPVKSPNQLAEQKAKTMTLQQLMLTIKTEKQVRDSAKEEQLKKQQLFMKQQHQKDNYERKIFMRKTVKPIETAKEPCPICQVEAKMVKSNTCHHSMCQQCWDKWLAQDLRCPICRGRVRKNFLVEEAK